jgi:voltage-gated potassium channel
MTKLRNIVENTDTIWGKAFDIFIQSLIVASLVTFSISTLPGLSDNTIKFLETFEAISIIIFSIEYILRVIVARKPLRYIFSFYGLIDLAAILPFFLTAKLDLRSLRILRLFRLFRLLKLVRYSNALKRFGTALKMASEELLLFLIGSLFFIFLSAAGIYFFEHEAQPETFSSIFTSLWWAVTSLTTVGYGDLYPITVGGRIFTFFILMIGLGIVAVPTGILASTLSKVREQSKQEKNETDQNK